MIKYVRNIKICQLCKNTVLVKHQRKYCLSCLSYSGIKIKSSINASGRIRREYQFLLENAERLSIREFIRLQVLSEMFGRDIEEWVNSVPHLGRLQAGMIEERRKHDEGEKRK